MKHQKIKGKWYLAGLAVCVLLFGVSLFQVISHYAGAQKAEEEFTKLAEIVEQRTGTDRGADRRYAGGRTGGRGAGSDLSLRAVCRAVCHE